MFIVRCNCCTRPEIGGRYFLVGKTYGEVDQSFDKARRFDTLDEAKAARDEANGNATKFDVLEVAWLVKSKDYGDYKGAAPEGVDYDKSNADALGSVYRTEWPWGPREKALRFATREKARQDVAVKRAKTARVVRVLRKVA